MQHHAQQGAAKIHDTVILRSLWVEPQSGVLHNIVDPVEHGPDLRAVARILVRADPDVAGSRGVVESHQVEGVIGISKVSWQARHSGTREARFELAFPTVCREHAVGTSHRRPEPNPLGGVNQGVLQSDDAVAVSMTGLGSSESLQVGFRRIDGEGHDPGLLYDDLVLLERCHADSDVGFASREGQAPGVDIDLDAQLGVSREQCGKLGHQDVRAERLDSRDPHFAAQPVVVARERPPDRQRLLVHPLDMGAHPFAGGSEHEASGRSLEELRSYPNMQPVETAAHRWLRHGQCLRSGG